MPLGKLSLIYYAQHRFQRHGNAARLYQALATREQDKALRELLLLLAAHESQSALLQARKLEVLRVPVPEDYDRWGNQVWRWLLVHCGMRFTLAWIEWEERNDGFFWALLTHAQRTKL